LTRLARVVEIQHRGDGVDPQAVGVVLLEPEQRVRQEEVPDLVAAVVEDQRAPVLVLALARILVLEERRPVEARQAVRVLREMSRHPVEDDADAFLVAPVHEELEILRRPEPRRRREEAEHLIAPRSGERMLHHGQELDVGETGRFHVGHQPIGELAVRQEAIAVLGDARPRSEVHLVDRHRLLEPRARGLSRRHPLAIAPAVARRVAHDRRRLRRRLERARERIGLLQNRAGSRADLVLVLLALGQVGHEDFPHPAGHEHAHRRHAPVPSVEVADHAHAIGVRRPHREVDAGGSAERDAMRPELVEHPVVRAFADQVQIEIGEDAAVPIRIVDLEDVARMKGDAQAVVGTRVVPSDAGHEKSGGVDLLHRHHRGARDEPEIDRLRGGMKDPHDGRAVVLHVRPQE
jgi:hypothetical protein